MEHHISSKFLLLYEDIKEIKTGSLRIYHRQHYEEALVHIYVYINDQEIVSRMKTGLVNN